MIGRRAYLLMIGQHRAPVLGSRALPVVKWFVQGPRIGPMPRFTCTRPGTPHHLTTTRNGLAREAQGRSDDHSAMWEMARAAHGAHSTPHRSQIIQIDGWLCGRPPAPAFRATRCEPGMSGRVGDYSEIPPGGSFSMTGSIVTLSVPPWLFVLWSVIVYEKFCAAFVSFAQFPRVHVLLSLRTGA